VAEDLRNVNLNLLVVFDAIWSARSVSQAADRLSLTQSAVSAALKRLRELFDDALFVRTGRYMTPTGKAELLAPRVRVILNQVRDTLAGDFETPRNVRREFTIATADYIDWLIGAPLVQLPESEAPNIVVYLTAIKPYMTEGQVSAETELFLCPAGIMNTMGLASQRLFSERYVCIAAAGNEAAGEGMSADAFLRLPHVAFTTDPKRVFSHETRHLVTGRQQPRNVVLTPHYLSIPLIVARSGAVAVVQERLARFMAEVVPLEIFEPPLPYPELELTLYWHPQFDHDHVHGWLRERLTEIGAELDAGHRHPRRGVRA